MNPYAKHGTAVRLAYLAVALVGWYVLRLLRALGYCRDDVIILCYHSISSDQKKSFIRQMVSIAARTVGVDRLSQAAQAGGKFPKVCITFDDGFSCLRENALPILRRLKIPAMIFPVAGNLGRPPRWEIQSIYASEANRTLMSGEEILHLAGTKYCRLGSHTRTHCDLARLSRVAIKQELFESRRDLERLVGTPVEDLALPYGSYDPEVLTVALETGYKRIFTLDPHRFIPGRSGKVIGRFSMSPDVWPMEFFLTTQGAYAWLGAWRQILHRIQHKTNPLFKERCKPHEYPN